MPCGALCHLPFELAGPFAGPTVVRPSALSRDADAGAGLYKLSERLVREYT